MVFAIFLAPYAAAQKNAGLYVDPKSHRYFSGSALSLSDQVAQKENRPLEISVDEKPFEAYKGPLNFRQEGKHTIALRLAPLGHTSEGFKKYEITVDLTPPTSQAQIKNGPFLQKGNDFVVSNEARIALSAQDPLSGVDFIEYSWDGVYFQRYLTTLSIQRNGSHTLFFRAQDHLGNREQAKSIHVLVDSLPPASEVSVSGKSQAVTFEGRDYVVINDGSRLSVNAFEDQSRIQAIWAAADGAPFSKYTKPFYFLKEGPHTLSYYAEDTLGNREKAHTVSLFTLSSPSHTHAQVDGKSVVRDGVRYVAQLAKIALDNKPNLAGVEKIEYKLDEEKEIQFYKEPIRIASPGKHSLSFRSVDNVGNWEPLQTFNFTLFATPPETHAETTQQLFSHDGKLYSPLPNNVILKTDPTPVGIDHILVSVNEHAFMVYQAPIPLIPENGSFKLAFKAIDPLGNEEKIKSVSYQVLPGDRPLYALPGPSQEKEREEYLAAPLLIPLPKKH